MNQVSRFAVLVENENAEPDLMACLGLMSDVFRHSGAWGEVTRRIKELAEMTREASLEGIVETLFRSRMLSGDKDNYDDPRNSFLDHCLATGKGLPITLCLIAREVACANGVPAALVGLPGHVVLSEGSSAAGGRFFDPFNGGRELSRRECLSIAAMGGHLSSPSVLAPMTSRAVLIRILNNLSRSFQRERDAEALWRCAAFRLAMPEIRRADAPGTYALVKQLN